MKEKRKLYFSPLTRREFLNYAWLAALGFSIALFAAWLLPHKEKQPLEKSFSLLGPSTAKDLGDWLEGNPFENAEQEFYIADTQSNQGAYIHGKYDAMIDDVDKWLDDPNLRSKIAGHDLFIICGANELTKKSQSGNYQFSEDDLKQSGTRVTDVLIKANRKLPGVNIHYIPPFPTLLNLSGWKYDARKKSFNDSVLESMSNRKAAGEITERVKDPLFIDDQLMLNGEINRSLFRDQRHFNDMGMKILSGAIFKRLS